MRSESATAVMMSEADERHESKRKHQVDAAAMNAAVDAVMLESMHTCETQVRIQCERHWLRRAATLLCWQRCESCSATVLGCAATTRVTTLHQR